MVHITGLEHIINRWIANVLTNLPRSSTNKGHTTSIYSCCLLTMLSRWYYYAAKQAHYKSRLLSERVVTSTMAYIDEIHWEIWMGGIWKHIISKNHTGCTNLSYRWSRSHVGGGWRERAYAQRLTPFIIRDESLDARVTYGPNSRVFLKNWREQTDVARYHACWPKAEDDLQQPWYEHQ